MHVLHQILQDAKKRIEIGYGLGVSCGGGFVRIGKSEPLVISGIFWDEPFVHKGRYVFFCFLEIGGYDAID